MSGKLQGEIFTLDLPPTLRNCERVLSAIANHADDDGQGAYPGIELLAWELRKSERQVKRDLQQLRTAGILIATAYEHGGNGKATRYAVQLAHVPGKPCPACEQRNQHAAGCRRSKLRLHEQTAEKVTVSIDGEKGDIAVSPLAISTTLVDADGGSGAGGEVEVGSVPIDDASDTGADEQRVTSSGVVKRFAVSSCICVCGRRITACEDPRQYPPQHAPGCPYSQASPGGLRAAGMAA